MGIRALRRIQLGQEATAGTAVAATALWRGIGVLADEREVVFPPEDIGFISGVDRTYIPRLAGSISLEPTPATFEQLPYIGAGGIEDITTGVADGAGTGRIYENNMPTITEQANVQTFTVEGGDNVQAEEMEFAFVESFELSGVAGEAWMMSAVLRGRRVLDSTFTGAIAVPAVDEVLFGQTSLYIDAVGGTIGTTQITNTLLEARVIVNTGLKGQETGDGNLYFSFLKRIMPEITIELVFEYNAAAHTQKGEWRSEVPKLMRLQSLGPALGTPGTAHTFKTMRVDAAGKWESFEAIDERDGNDVISATFRVRQNGTANRFFDLVTVNELATLP